MQVFVENRHKSLSKACLTPYVAYVAGTLLQSICDGEKTEIQYQKGSQIDCEGS